LIFSGLPGKDSSSTPFNQNRIANFTKITLAPLVSKSRTVEEKL
jgi:hypothetical protein